MPAHSYQDEQPAAQEQPLHPVAGVLAHLPDTHLSATVIDSPEGPVADGNGRSPSTIDGRDAPVPDHTASQQPANGQSTPALGPRLDENGRLLTAREVADLLAVP